MALAYHRSSSMHFLSPARHSCVEIVFNYFSSSKGLRAFYICAICIAISACGKSIRWKQDVVLHDGHIIVVERVSKLAGKSFPEGSYLEYEQALIFKSPISGEKIVWTLPKGSLPTLLDFHKGTPYLVLRAGSVADYNAWGCPNPPFIVYQYTDKKWRRISLENLPHNFTIPNLLLGVSTEPTAIEDGIVTVAEMEASRRSSHPQFQIISREKINPIGNGCFASTLIKQERHNEIDTRR